MGFFLEPKKVQKGFLAKKMVTVLIPNVTQFVQKTYCK